MTNEMRLLKDRIATRLNDCLCEMKPGYDDSIVGFNEAWDIVRKTIDEPAPKPALPRISKLVGTDPRDLLEQIIDAANAVSHARQVLQASSPHASDYDPMAPRGERHQDAMDRHVARLAKLDDVLAELRVIGEHVSDSIPAIGGVADPGEHEHFESCDGERG